MLSALGSLPRGRPATGCCGKVPDPSKSGVRIIGSRSRRRTGIRIPRLIRLIDPVGLPACLHVCHPRSPDATFTHSGIFIFQAFSIHLIETCSRGPAPGDNSRPRTDTSMAILSTPWRRAEFVGIPPAVGASQNGTISNRDCVPL
jgi:hypothetical protein